MPCCMHISQREKEAKMVTIWCKEYVTSLCMECFEKYVTVKNIRFNELTFVLFSIYLYLKNKAKNMNVHAKKLSPQF